jgi:hypothetical protein
VALVAPSGPKVLAAHRATREGPGFPAQADRAAAAPTTFAYYTENVAHGATPVVPVSLQPARQPLTTELEAELTEA